MRNTRGCAPKESCWLPPWPPTCPCSGYVWAHSCWPPRFGARVYPGPIQEIALGTVTLTEDGLRDPVLGPAGARLPVLHWHGDTFELPAGARRLAGNETYRNQPFRVGHRAYGLQFHLEITCSMVDGLLPLPAEAVVSRAGVPAIESVGHAVVRRMFTALAT